MNKILKYSTVSALLGLLSAPALSVQAQILEANWSPDFGPSLFQSLGITTPPYGDAGSSSAFATSQILSSRPTNIIVSTGPIPNSLKVSENLSVAPQPLTGTDRSIDTAPASSFPLAAAPPKRAGSEEAGPIASAPSNSAYTNVPEQGSEPVQIAQVENSQMSKSVIKPTDPPNMLKGELAYDGWGSLLSKYTQKDESGLVLFDYAALAGSPANMKVLNEYLDDMASKKPSTFTREQAMVYWANLYNAITVKVVAENYPVKSIRKIKSGLRPGPWKRDLITVEGEVLSLDNIEHDIMRPTFKTPLVHYMVNCASIGCPNLKQTPWQVSTLEADLEAAARAYINSSRGATIDKGRLKVSSIYKWFSKDFGGSQTGVIEHLKKYADDDLSPRLIGRNKIDKYGYDWDINAP